jgi:ABC-type dipeptide/oligopeptide/nickel transport system permease subunit
MIEQGAGVRAFETYPHLLLVSALPVILFLYAWTLLGDALVDILEPRTTVR